MFNWPSNQSSSTYSEETIDILRLARSENVSPRLFFQLIEFFGSAKKALDNIPQLAERGGKTKPIKVYSTAEAEQEIRELSKIGASIITYQEPSYPKLLFHIADTPPVLTYKGNKSLLNNNIIAIVGARNASINGCAFASKIARDLVKHNITIVSGLARGIDKAAHESSLPNTIAIIAGGIDHIYPLENKDLYNKIAQDSLIVAELPIKTAPIGPHFPQRNRLISGISLATVVIEAGLKSGSLITARFAAEQGREVFAAPGFPLDPRSYGSNKLIREGAIMIEDARDIIDNLATFEKIHNKLQENNKYEYSVCQIPEDYNVNDEIREKVVNLLSASPTSIELIIEYSNLPIAVIYSILLELELAGKIARYPGNKIALLY